MPYGLLNSFNLTPDYNHMYLRESSSKHIGQWRRKKTLQNRQLGKQTKIQIYYLYKCSYIERELKGGIVIVNSDYLWGDKEKVEKALD